MSSGSLASIGGVHPRTETHPCRECRTPTGATVLWRETTTDRGWPVCAPGAILALCDACDARDQEESFAPAEPEGDPVLDFLLGIGVNTRKHGHATVENFDDTDAPRAPSATRRFIDDAVAARRHDRVVSLFLVGPTGTGKSHLAVAAIRAFHEARPSGSVIYDPADRLITRLQDTYSTGGTDAFIERRRTADLYVLDDLGREKATPDALRTLCTILDEREGAPTLITANATPEELGVRFNDRELWGRVGSRLGDRVYRYVAVEGPDRRFQESAA